MSNPPQMYKTGDSRVTNSTPRCLEHANETRLHCQCAVDPEIELQRSPFGPETGSGWGRRSIGKMLEWLRPVNV